MTKSEKIITSHIAKMNGLTSPSIAEQATPYAFSTCQRVFKKFAQQHSDYPGKFFYGISWMESK